MRTSSSLQLSAFSYQPFALSPEPCALLPDGLRPHVRGEDTLAQPDRRRRDFDQLIVVDEFDRLLEAELARRDQTNRLVGGRGAHVRLLLLLADIDVHVRGA